MAGLVDRVTKSEVNKELDHNSDPIPISTILDKSVPNANKAPRKN